MKYRVASIVLLYALLCGVPTQLRAAQLPLPFSSLLACTQSEYRYTEAQLDETQRQYRTTITDMAETVYAALQPQLFSPEQVVFVVTFGPCARAHYALSVEQITPSMLERYCQHQNLCLRFPEDPDNYILIEVRIGDAILSDPSRFTPWLAHHVACAVWATTDYTEQPVQHPNGPDRIFLETELCQIELLNTDNALAYRYFDLLGDIEVPGIETGTLPFVVIEAIKSGTIITNPVWWQSAPVSSHDLP